MAQIVKNVPVMQETRVQPLGREDTLEEGMATHSNFLAWRIPWTEKPGGLQSTGSQRVRHDYRNNEDLQTEVHAFLSPPETSPSAFSSSTWKCQFSSCSANSILDFFISYAIGAMTLLHAPVIFHQDFCSRLPTHLPSPILPLL